MELMVKSFEELTKKELYELLLLRSEVFIVEQGGCYQDPDRIDYDSTHIFIQDGEKVSGCVRVFLKEDEEGTCQLGRLVVRDRMQGLGTLLMDRAEEAAAELDDAKRVFLTGRRSARGFYERCGYVRQLPEGYTEENTPYFIFRKDL